MIRKMEGWEKHECFLELKNPIKGFWIDGKLEKEELGKMVAVVGSRRNTEYGRRVVEKLVGRLINSQRPVVSGFMYGTDQAVHRAVLEAGGKTVAVLGWGIKYSNLDEDDKKLWQKIVDFGGAVISEWETQAPAFWTFPARDRIMAAISSELYVVEAANKSGALITADIARDLKRIVWAVPGSIFSSVSAGTNRYIAEGKAKMWLPSQQLSMNLGTESNYNDSKVYTLLQNEIFTADEVAKKLGKPIDEILRELMMLVLEGKVAEREGKYQLVTN